VTPTERKLAAHLLRLAADQFSNHGCNDFDLSKLIPDQDERDALVREFEEWSGSPDEYRDQSGSADWRMMDYAAMYFMADQLEGVV
jgi:hypothetical protein